MSAAPSFFSFTMLERIAAVDPVGSDFQAFIGQ